MNRPVRWVPREHGAWAILAVPLLLGVAAAGAQPWHAVLAVAAVSAYLFSVPAVEWMRTRRREYQPPAVVFGIALAASGAALVARWPELLVVAALVAVAGIADLALALAGRPRSVAVSLVEVAQAAMLVPAAAIIAGTLAEPATGRAALAAALYLVGSVLLVRSMIRARGDSRYLAASVGFHAAGVVAAAVWLTPPYVVLSVALLGRAIAFPWLQARRAGSPRPLRPIHIGIGEIVASVALVSLALIAGF